MKRLSIFFIFAFLVFPVAASQVWFAQTNGPVSAKPVFFEDKMVVGSQDGSVYLLYYSSGNLFQRTDLGQPVTSVKVAGNGMLIASSKSSLFIMDKSLNVVRTINETLIYGFEAGDAIYISTDRGMAAFSYEGQQLWLYQQKQATFTSPTLDNGRLVVGMGDKLAVFGTDGNLLSSTQLSQMWKSRPVISGETAFVGANDGRMYAVDLASGKIKWSYSTGGWIMSDPLYDAGSIYFGSNDGNLYSLSATSGSLIWKFKTPEAIQGALESVLIGARKAVMSGSNDNRVYFFDARNGSQIVTYSAKGWVRSPAFKDNMLFFGSYDGGVYAYVADRGCTIDQPISGQSVAYSVFNVSGTVFTRYTSPRLFLRINNESWLQTQVSGNSWSYAIDPSDYEFGGMLLECKISDSAGTEQYGFTRTIIFRDSSISKFSMRVVVPAYVGEGDKIIVAAYDESGQPLNSFTVSMGNKSFTSANGTASFRLQSAGSYSIIVKKPGYADVPAIISISPNYMGYAPYIVLGILIIGIAGYFLIYKRKIAQ